MIIGSFIIVRFPQKFATAQTDMTASPRRLAIFDLYDDHTNTRITNRSNLLARHGADHCKSLKVGTGIFRVLSEQRRTHVTSRLVGLSGVSVTVSNCSVIPICHVRRYAKLQCSIKRSSPAKRKPLTNREPMYLHTAVGCVLSLSESIEEACDLVVLRHVRTKDVSKRSP